MNFGLALSICVGIVLASWLDVLVDAIVESIIKCVLRHNEKFLDYVLREGKPGSLQLLACDIYEEKKNKNTEVKNEIGFKM